MNELWGHVVGALIVLMTLTFIAIWIWVWQRGHAEKFDALARLPMQDEGDVR